MSTISKYKILSQAKESFSKAEYKNALEKFAEVLQNYPHSKEAYNGVILSEMAMSGEDGAEALFDYYEVLKEEDKDTYTTTTSSSTTSSASSVAGISAKSGGDAFNKAAGYVSKLGQVVTEAGVGNDLTYKTSSGAGDEEIECVDDVDFIDADLFELKSPDTTISRTIEIEMAVFKEYGFVPFNIYKKERIKIDKEVIKLERNLGGIKDMRKLPGAIVIVDPSVEKIAVKEANLLNIPIVGLVDTNCDPEPVRQT